MGQIQLLRGGTLAKRLRQLAYLCGHPLDHYRCSSAIRRAEVGRDPVIGFKYLGEHLSLSLHASERRKAQIGHYSALLKLLQPSVRRRLRNGVLLWRKDLPGDCPPLSIFLEPSRLAPMEGELQLTFSFRTELFVLTFLFSPGHVFDAEAGSVVFIGGVQGRVGSREEMREASKLNGEISPAAMLILAIQAFADAAGVDQLIAIGENDHISMAYSPSAIRFDYRDFWIKAGGKRVGRYYRIPIKSPQKPLSEVPLSHRGRTKRKREAKILIRQSLERRFRHILAPAAGLAASARPALAVRPSCQPAFS